MRLMVLSPLSCQGSGFGCYVALVFAVLTWLSSSATVQANHGASDERLSLADGPGSVGGVGSSVSDAGNLGAMRYQVDLELPEGFPEATPRFSLQYNSLSGNGEIGVGWDLPIPHVERFTQRGLPRFDATDVFAADGGEELVRVATDDGSAVYRTRFEQGFARYTWHTDAGGRGGYWEAEYPDGSRGFFGADSSGQLARASRVSTGENDAAVFRYMLVESVDRLGHRVHYDYELDGRYPLLRRVEYLFKGEPGSSAQPRYQVFFAYEARTDVISSGAPGFDLRLSQRLSSVEVRSRHRPIRRYELSYQQAEAGTSRLVAIQQFGVDGARYPAAIALKYTSSLELGCRDCTRPFLFDMGRLQASGSGGLDMHNGRSTVIDINGDALPDLLDTDLSGRHRFFVNTLDAEGGQAFAPPRSSRATADGSSFVLDRPGVQVLDLNGDGFVDVLDASGNRVMCNRGGGDWEPDAFCAGELGVRLGAELQDDPEEVGESDPRGMRFTDVDGDRRIDLLHTLAPGAARVWRNTPQGGAFESLPGPERVFDQGNLQLADLNGDGLLDVIDVTEQGDVWYRLHLGFARWSEALTFPLRGKSPRETFGEAELQDVNGDGLDDLVIVRGQSVRLALNVAGRFAPLQSLYSKDVEGGLPHADGNTTVLFADMNGSGTTDIVWVDSLSGQVKVLELFSVRPNLLTEIDNGIGGIQKVEYGTSAREQSRDSQEGNPWSHRLPQPMNVVTAMESYASASPDIRSRVEFRYHGGFYDGQEKRFGGFAAVTEWIAPGDGQQASLRERHFDVGSQDPYRRGRILREQSWGGERQQKSPLQRVRHFYERCEVAGADSTDPTRPVQHVCETATETLLQEGRPESEWRTLRTQRSYDAYGRVRLEARLGVVGIGEGGRGGCEPCEVPDTAASGACGVACLGDEFYTQTDYIRPESGREGRWILGAAWRTQAYSEPDGVRSETLHYYDGPAFRGLALGRLSRGNLVRTCQKRTENAEPDCEGVGWVQSTRAAFDAHGNLVTVLDALGAPGDFQGHRRSIEYGAYQLKPVSETVYLSVDGEPYRLVRRARYDDLFYQPAAVTRWMLQGAPVRSDASAQQTAYDAFGRRSKVALPGDSLDSPTHEFDYQLSPHVSRIVARSRSQAGRAADLERVQCLDGLGRTLQTRTRIGQGLYQVTGFHEVNEQGLPVRVYAPYQGGSACESEALVGVPYRRLAYDALGRPVRVEEPDAELYGEPSATVTEYGPLTTVVYDPADNDSESPAYHTPHTTYRDGLGRVVAMARVLSARGTASRLRALWGPLGQLAGYVDPAGNHKWQVYDLLGQVVEVKDPNAGTTRFEYDVAGNRVARTDARGKTLQTEYDGANRPVAEYEADDRAGTLSEMRYDFAVDCAECSHGEWKLVQSKFPLGGRRGWGVDRHGFDLRGRGILAARSLGGRRFVTRTQVDNLGRVVRRRYPDQRWLSYRYDQASRLTRVEGVVDDIQYDTRGQPSHVSYANGVDQHYAYDTRRRLSQTRMLGANGEVLQRSGYQRDRVGNLDAIWDTADARPDKIDFSVEFEHDAWYRVTEARWGGGAEVVESGFDVMDNLQRKSLVSLGAGHTGSYEYGLSAPNAVSRAGRWAFTYDRAGLMSQRGGTVLRWNAEKLLESATTPDGHHAEYSYDATGVDRVMEVHDGSVRYYLGPNFEIRDGVAYTYIRVGDQRVARRAHTALGPMVLDDLNGDGGIGVSDALVAVGSDDGASRYLWAAARRLLVEAGDELVFLHADHLKSLTLATDASGRVVGERAFYPTGELRREVGYVDAYGFTGQRRDETTGLTHFRFRELDASVGRWTSPDPLFEVATPQNLSSWGESSTAYAYVSGRWDVAYDLFGLTTSRRKALPRVTGLVKAGGLFATFRPVPSPRYIGKGASRRASLWVSDRTNTSENLGKLVAKLYRNHRARYIKVLTGTHGSATGAVVKGDGDKFLESDEFVVNTTLTESERDKLRIEYVDVNRKKGDFPGSLEHAVMGARPGEHVICAWCYSDRNKDLVGLYHSALGPQSVSSTSMSRELH